MKILHLTTHTEIGGITTYVLTLSKELKRMGEEVVVASSGGRMKEELSGNGIKHLTLNIKTKCEFSPKLLSAFNYLKKYIKDERIGIIHAHTRVTQVLGSLLSRSLSIPLVVTCHGFFRRRIGRMLFPCWGKRVIAISGAVKRHLEALHKVPACDIEVIYNGVDIERFSGNFDERDLMNLQASFGLKDGYVVGTISRLVHLKGIDCLIRAFGRLLAAYPDAQLLIIGSGPDESRLKAIARELNISGSVVMREARFDTPRILALMDVFVLPSIRDEGLGIALLEAMASSRPVIGTRVGGIEELITDEEDGILIEPRREDLIAKAISGIINDPEKADGLGRNARRSAERRFNSRTMAQRIHSIYRRLI